MTRVDLLGEIVKPPRNIKMNKGLFSSTNQSWATPIELFQTLNDEFQFTLDVCASSKNAKCDRFFDELQDGLMQAWSGVCWMNPPYNRCSEWMAKAYRESLNGVTVVCLVPSRTDTTWFHNYALHGEIRFIRGRLKFGSGKSNAPFPSCVVIFRGKV